MTPIETVLTFLDRINQHNADQVAELMSEDTLFIDSLGQRVRGRETLRKGWRGYFLMCPDYRVSHEKVFANGNTVAVFGSAGGTISVNGQLPAENRWQTTAAWRGVVEKGLIQEWQVYADNKPVYEILSKSAKLGAK